MVGHWITSIVLGGVAALVWALNWHYQTIQLDKFFYTAVALFSLYTLFRVVLEDLVSKRIPDSKARYSFRKVMRILFLVLAFIVVLRIWVVNPQALLVAYGLVAAGVAISLQDIFKNFAGGVTILLTGLYQVGNRIEINGKYGDVIDISIFYTTILENREWVDGDQATGRLSMIPNGAVLSNVVNNYTKDHHFLWDELSFPVTYDSDWKKGSDMMQRLATEVTGEFSAEARASQSHMEERYYLSERTMEPNVYVKADDNWITLTVRYVVEVRERRFVQSKLTQLILDEIDKDPHLSIASATLAITEFPEISVEEHSV